MVLGKERAVTHLNSWNRCLVREDGMLSPASLYLLTVVACTRSWSQMAALWRSIHRRTGETTVRISMAIQQIRNWVRKPIYVLLTVCVRARVCVFICAPVLSNCHIFWYCSHCQHQAHGQLTWGNMGIVGLALNCQPVLDVSHLDSATSKFLKTQNS